MDNNKMKKIVEIMNFLQEFEDLLNKYDYCISTTAQNEIKITDFMSASTLASFKSYYSHTNGSFNDLLIPVIEG